LKFLMTSAFGALEEIRSGKSHTGIDLQMPTGTKLRSIADGVVERVTNYGDRNIGNGVIIRSEDGSLHIFGHMDKVSVSPGDHVSPGTFLGTSGNSGFSTGPHLHFGMWKDGHFVDPSSVIEKVDAYAGGMVVTKHTGILTDLIISKAREKAKETATDTILGIWDAIHDLISQTEYSVFLIGTGILVILRNLGFKHPWLRPGVLIGVHFFLRILLLGGLAV
jgi:hypothetical protein